MTLGSSYANGESYASPQSNNLIVHSQNRLDAKRICLRVITPTINVRDVLRAIGSKCTRRSAWEKASIKARQNVYAA